MKKRHYFIIFHDISLGGIQKKIIDLLNYVGESKNHSICVFHLILETDEKPNLIEEIRNDKVIIHYWPKLIILRRYQKQYFYCYYLFLFLRFRPKSIYLFSLDMLEPTLWVKRLTRSLRTKIYFSIDTILSFYNRIPHSSLVLSNDQVTSVVNQADLVLTQTAYSKNDLIDNYRIDKDKILVIPNWMHPMPVSSSSKKQIDIIYFGRFARQKRMDLMLKIFKKILMIRPHTNIQLVGSGEDEQTMRDFIKSNNLNSIVIQQFTSKVLERVRVSKCTVLTSEFEGHPIALLESMSLGVVPVVLRYPGCEEYICNTKDGYIEENENKMVARIIQLLDNESLRKTIGQGSIASVKRKYNEKNLVKTLNQITG